MSLIIKNIYAWLGGWPALFFRKFSAFEKNYNWSAEVLFSNITLYHTQWNVHLTIYSWYPVGTRVSARLEIIKTHEYLFIDIYIKSGSSPGLFLLCLQEGGGWAAWIRIFYSFCGLLWIPLKTGSLIDSWEWQRGQSGLQAGPLWDLTREQWSTKRASTFLYLHCSLPQVPPLTHKTPKEASDKEIKHPTFSVPLPPCKQRLSWEK